MKEETPFEVIIIGGSYAGLAAAMSLGRALRNVLVIDSGQSCNRQTPYSHNFITHDGETPQQIRENAKAQVLKYPTVSFLEGFAVTGNKTGTGFNIKTETGTTFSAKKLIFATGLKDLMPNLEGFSECWGISILHCPYCHGYEVRNQQTAIINNGEAAFHYGLLIPNWTKNLTLLTNGKSTLTEEQTAKLKTRNIPIIETEIEKLEQENGKVKSIYFKNGEKLSVAAIYSRPSFVQHSPIPETLGCELTEQGLLKVDPMNRTTVPGVYACGDNSQMRSVAVAVASGTSVGAFANYDLIMEAT